MRVMPRGCVFADKGPAAFVSNDSTEELLALLTITVSIAFKALVELQMAFGSFEVGVIQRTPIPKFDLIESKKLARICTYFMVLEKIIGHSK